MTTTASVLKLETVSPGQVVGYSGKHYTVIGPSVYGLGRIAVFHERTQNVFHLAGGSEVELMDVKTPAWREKAPVFQDPPHYWG